MPHSLNRAGCACARSPQCGRPGAGRRRQVFAECLEDLADEAFGRPVREPDVSPALQDSQQLGGCLVLIRRKHHAESGNNSIEAIVVERQVLSVSLYEVDRQALRCGARTPRFQRRGHIVSRGDIAPATSRSVTMPLPAATSSTLEPDLRSSASQSSSPTICSVVPTMA